MIVLLGKKLQWSAYLRTAVTCRAADRTQQRSERGIVNVAAVPGQQVVNAMHRRNSDVQCIGPGRRRHCTFGYETLGQDLRLFIGFQQRNTDEKREPSCSAVCVTSGSFYLNQFGDEELVPWPGLVPPLGCDLLPSGSPDIAAGSGRQMAGD